MDFDACIEEVIIIIKEKHLVGEIAKATVMHLLVFQITSMQMKNKIPYLSWDSKNIYEQTKTRLEEDNYIVV